MKHFISFIFIIIISWSTFTNLQAKNSELTNRPKIGLVFSGGGAKGFAHIGILGLIDSLKIPIDYIAGTSMGAIIGGFYAIGYNGYDLEAMAFRNDWDEIFSDKPPRRLLPYFEKKDTGRFQLEFGMVGTKPVTPSALIYGQKVSLLLSSLTFPYERITDFDNLPIPFRCVAVDLVTGNEVVLKQGSLAKALRSSMSIPTVFSPVEWGDSLLVDGGMVNNLPVNVVKEMGADLVIAVDVENPLFGRDKLKSVTNILNQSITLLGLERKLANLDQVDVLIRPEIAGFSVLDFSDEKIRAIIKNGKQAAYHLLPELLRLKEICQIATSVDSSQFYNQQARNYIQNIQISGRFNTPFSQLYDALQLKHGDVFDLIAFKQKIAEIRMQYNFEKIEYQIIPEASDSLRILLRVQEKNLPIVNGISIKNNTTLPFAFIYRLLGLKPGDLLNTELLNFNIMQIYGLGYFERLHYDIEPLGEKKVNITLHVKELPARKLRVGLRYDDLHKLVAVVNGQATNFLIPGLRMESEIQFAGLKQYYFKAYYPSRALNLPVYPFFCFNYRDIPTRIFDEVGNQIAEYRDHSVAFGGGIGLLFSRSLNAEICYQRERMDIKPEIAFSDPIIFPSWDDQLREIHASINFDNLDDILLPRKGILLKTDFEGSHQRLDSEVKYARLSVAMDFYHTIARKHTTRFYAFWGKSTYDLPVYKYFAQGRPDYFVGMEYDQLVGTEMSILRFDYRFQYKKDIFLKLMVNEAFNVKYRLNNSQLSFHNMMGYGLGVLLLSPIGPIEITYARGDKTYISPHRWQNIVYVNMGYKF
ncbi:patatin-like phospholipase family protein [candidate division KSB1 bacterium]|nr:patatin-like phospholipase family protein [candidate division KSB1 bacterium]